MNVVIYSTTWTLENNQASPALPATISAYTDVTGQQTILPEPNVVVVAILCDDATLSQLDQDMILISQPFDEESDFPAQVEALLNG